MTFCLGIKVEEGIVGIADTRVLSGSEVILARKVAVFQQEGQSMFLMTSGLRSLRDKAVTYFEEAISDQGSRFDRLFKAVNVFATQVRRVAGEDQEPLAKSDLPFDFYALIGGQFKRDKEHRLYLVYPQGNWIEVGHGTPYQIIGSAGYGKPILDRTLKYDDPMRHALKVGCLAFDSTRISAAAVDFPIDVILYARDSFRIVEHRYEKNDLLSVSGWWQERLRQSVNELPSDWIDASFAKLKSSRDNIGRIANRRTR
ncbi:MAG TPA: peptidase [Candidatus Binatia bacterium]|nr:peptidase [Candidatus Binatia bacterium]